MNRRVLPPAALRDADDRAKLSISPRPRNARPSPTEVERTTAVAFIYGVIQLVGAAAILAIAFALQACDSNAPSPCSWRYTKYLATADSAGAYVVTPIDSVYECHHAAGGY